MKFIKKLINKLPFFKKEVISNELILEILKCAKEKYVERKDKGLCNYISTELYLRDKTRHYAGYDDIEKIIPEYNREFLGATTEDTDAYWWREGEYQNRINAFDKLIKVYEEKLEKTIE